MGLDVHQIYASNDSLHPPRHLLFLLHCCVLPSLSLSLSTPPTAAPWTPFPHFLPPLLHLCLPFSSSFSLPP